MKVSDQMITDMKVFDQVLADDLNEILNLRLKLNSRKKNTLHH